MKEKGQEREEGAMYQRGEHRPVVLAHVVDDICARDDAGSDDEHCAWSV
jgi:hypothetical protein